MKSQQTKCMWCGKDTSFIQAEECDNCWEMRSRIARNLPLAKKMIASLEARKKKGEKDAQNH